MRKSEKLKEALSLLAKRAMTTIEMLDEILPNYYRSYKNAKRSMYVGGIAAKKELKETVAKQRFYSLLSHLKRQGLIEKKVAGDKPLWKITSNGLNKLKRVRQRMRCVYETKKDDKMKIVVFDIYEKEKWKREWLRDALKNMEFKMLQRSVWMGRSKIPEAFLDDLRIKHLLGCVHVLEVSRVGTVKGLF